MTLMLAVAACGSDDSDSSSATTAPATPATAAGGALKLTAEEKGGLSFDKKDLSAKSGEVTITMDNPSGASLPHDIAIEGEGVEEAGEVVGPGGTSQVKAELKPGTYTFYCSVGQHRQAGMEGTLTVQ